MNNSRPKNLNLFTIRFPIPAIVSILHRISGVILFLCIPLILWFLHYSLTDEGFASLQDYIQAWYVRFLIWLILLPLWFHLVAGIRHLLSDIHIGDALKTGRLTAQLSFVITFILAILTGIWLW